MQLVYAVCNDFAEECVSARRLALVLADRLVHARVLEAARGVASVWVAPTLDEVTRAIGTHADIAATVVYLTPARLPEALRGIEALRQSAPEHPVIGYADPRALSARFILDTGRAQLTDLVLLDLDDSRAVLRRVLEQAQQAGTCQRLAALAAEGQPREVRTVLEFIFRHLREPLDVLAIAAGLGMTRRTLYHRLDAVGSPGPRELVSWCRVLYIAHELSSGTASMASIASQLDFPCWRNASALVRRHLTVGTTALRHRGGLEMTLAQFRAQFTAPSRPPVAPAPTRRLLVG